MISERRRGGSYGRGRRRHSRCVARARRTDSLQKVDAGFDRPAAARCREQGVGVPEGRGPEPPPRHDGGVTARCGGGTRRDAGFARCSDARPFLMLGSVCSTARAVPYLRNGMGGRDAGVRHAHLLRHLAARSGDDAMPRWIDAPASPVAMRTVPPRIGRYRSPDTFEGSTAARSRPSSGTRASPIRGRGSESSVTIFHAPPRFLMSRIRDRAGRRG